MLNLKDGTLWQWDIGRKIIVTLEEGSTIDTVQFYNGIGDNAYPATAIEIVDGEILAGIPNSLLCYANSLTVYLMTTDEDGVKTQEQITLMVNKRAKPEDYIFTDDEFHTYKVYDERLQYLEKNIVVPERLEEVVGQEIEKIIPRWARKATPDVTLTQAGEAAEAAKVGNEILSLKTRDNNLSQEIAVERARINNLTKAEESGLSTDAERELADIRVSADGTTIYDNAGDAVRSQIGAIGKKFDKAIRELNIDFEAHEHDGYLAYNSIDGFIYVEPDKYHTLHTDLITCNPGDVFRYYGNSRSEAKGWLLFLNGTLVDSGVCEGKTIVTIPEGVTHVIFQSFGTLEDKLYLEVSFNNSSSLVVQQEIQMSELEKVSGAFSYYKNNGYLVDFKGYLSFADKTKYHSLSTRQIPCKPGDVFRYIGVGRGSSASWLFFDDYFTSIEKGHNNASVPTETLVTIPEGVNYVMFSSFTNIDKEDLTLYVEYLGENAIKQRLLNEIEDYGAYGNPLYKKKYVACGDSFTEGDFSSSLTGDYFLTEGLYAGQKKVYPFFIGNRNKMEVVNMAKCGSTIACDGGSQLQFSASKYKEIPLDADYITLKYGINDDGSHHKIPIGTIDDTENTTFYGAWNIVMEWLITNLPYAKIGIIITNGSQGQTGYTEAQRNIAKKWGVPYLDEDQGEQVPLMFRVNKSGVCQEALSARWNAFVVNPDGNTHPNEKAHEYESTFVENFLRSL